MMISKRLMLACLVWSSGSAFGGEKAGPPTTPRPELGPGEVVEAQLEALQFNDRPDRDSGIATAFRFASPGNRKATGPLPRFIQIIKAPGYRPLIDHRVAGYGAMVIRGDVAIRRVTVVAADGQAFEYEFRLSKNPESNCWFTDGVILVPPPNPIEPGKVARSPHLSPASSLAPSLQTFQAVLPSEPG